MAIKRLGELLADKGVLFFSCCPAVIFVISPWSFHLQELFSNSPYCLEDNSFDSCLKNLVLDQLVIDIFLLFSSVACLILYGYYREKFCLGQSCELEGYISLSLFGASPPFLLLFWRVTLVNYFWCLWWNVGSMACFLFRNLCDCSFYTIITLVNVGLTGLVWRQTVH